LGSSGVLGGVAGVLGLVEELLTVSAHLTEMGDAAGDDLLRSLLSLPFACFTTRRDRLFPALVALALPRAGDKDAQSSPFFLGGGRLAVLRRGLSGAHLAAYLAATARAVDQPAASSSGHSLRRRSACARALALCAALPWGRWDAARRLLADDDLDDISGV
jgi:hypothetical protein